MGIYIAGPPEEGGELTHKETGPYYTFKESFWKRLWRSILTILQSAWAKRRRPFRAVIELVVSFIRLLLALILAILVTLGNTLILRAKRGYSIISRSAAAAKSRATSAAPDVFGSTLKVSLVLLGSLLVFILVVALFTISKDFREIVLVLLTNYLSLVWILCFAIAGTLRWIILPIKPDDSTTRSYIRLAPIGIAILFTAIYLVYIPGKILHDITGSIGNYVISGIGVVGLILLVIYLADKRNKDNIWSKTWEWFTHPLSFIGMAIIALNWLYWVFDPLTWLFFWAQPSKFWGLNIGTWIGTALLFVPNRDKDGQKLAGNHPVAKTWGHLILALVIITIGYHAIRINFFPETAVSASVATNRIMITGTPVVYSAKTNLPLPPQPIADAESGTCGVLGSSRQFDKNGQPMRNPTNPLAVGEWAINMNDQAVADLVKKRNLDVVNSREDNAAAASLLYADSGLRPWTASKHCWGDKIDRYQINQIAPFVIDVVKAPVGTWSEEVKNPGVANSILGFGRMDPTKGGECEVMGDRDPKKVFPIKSDNQDYFPEIVNFRCSQEGAEIRVRVVPK